MSQASRMVEPKAAGFVAQKGAYGSEAQCVVESSRPAASLRGRLAEVLGHQRLVVDVEPELGERRVFRAAAVARSFP